MLLGLGIPTCREGVAYSPGFASPREIVGMAHAAAAAGYDSIWGNQHLLTQQAVAATAAQPPSYYDPLVIMSYLAAKVAEVQLVFGTLVAPAHHPLVLAKQLATLDQLSGGRVVVGLGIGAYAEETDALARPGSPRRHRGRTLDELIGALRALFTEQLATFHGTEFEFDDAQSYPKPIGDLAILTSGDSPAGIERAARLGDGWIIASRSPEEILERRERMADLLGEHGRPDARLELAAQAWVCLGADDAEAERRLLDTQHFRRLLHMSDSATGELIDDFRRRNLLGSVDAVVCRVAEYEAAGVDHLALVFLGADARSVVDDARRLAKALGRRPVAGEVSAA